MTVDVNKVVDTASQVAAGAVVARNKYLDFVSNHPKMVCVLWAVTAVLAVVGWVR